MGGVRFNLQSKWMDKLFNFSLFLHALLLILSPSPPAALVFTFFHICDMIGGGRCQLTNESASECKQYVTTTTTAASAAAAAAVMYTDPKRGKWKRRKEERKPFSVVEKQNRALSFLSRLLSLSLSLSLPFSLRVSVRKCVCVRAHQLYLANMYL